MNQIQKEIAESINANILDWDDAPGIGYVFLVLVDFAEALMIEDDGTLKHSYLTPNGGVRATEDVISIDKANYLIKINKPKFKVFK